MVRSVLSKCVACFKAKRVEPIPLMGNLPSCRVQQVKVFELVGVDFAGLFIITLNRRNNY